MDHLEILNENSVYIERLQQAQRVLRGLSSQGSLKFNIDQFARKSADGIDACIAGLCGLDPWFKERGLITDVDKNRVNILTSTLPTQGFSDDHHIPSEEVTLEDFFGTERPFYKHYYPTEKPTISVQDAIIALDREIERLVRTSVCAAER
jgi:hypothetical protein